ncbi:MAG: hypothetical protein EOP39_17225 [Rubrivivax sp.]|nr:MAG: hypothetical protein EOP39_17225 [Rubrivivax sp.]
MALAMVLTACGGGGSSGSAGGTSGGNSSGAGSTGGGTGSTTPVDYKLSFSPASLSATYSEGSAQPLTVTATLDRAVSQTVNVAVVDSIGVIEPNVQLTPGTGLSYQATLQPKASLSVGEHSGSLQVKLCLDNPQTCASPLPGSPFLLPYKFTVTAPPAASANPAQVSAVVYQDDMLAFNLAISVPNAPAVVTFVDKAGTFQLNADPVRVTSQGLTSSLQMKAGLTPGSYTGQIELHVCKSQPCSQEMEGSPVLVPYSIALKSPINLSPLTRSASLAEWAQHQANAAHTGYVPLTLDARKFNRRWNWVSTYPERLATNASGIVQPIVTANDMLYALVSGESGSGNATLFALAENDGSLRWQKAFMTHGMNPPSTDSGSVYMATSGHSSTFMWGLDASTGAQKFSTPFDSQWDTYMAPTIANGKVYSDGGYYGGMYSFNAAGGTKEWGVGLSQYDRWTPAVDGSYAYVFMPAGLTGIKLSDGSKAFVIPAGTQGSDVNGAPMLIGAGNVVIMKGFKENGPNQLVNFDTAARNVKWSVTGSFTGTPAYAKDVIYAINGLQVEARSSVDGSLLWAWAPEETSTDPFKASDWQPKLNFIVTDNLLFVSTNSKVYALDLATHKTVWALSKAGNLALSPNAVLYITSVPTNGGRGGVYAVNLR